jgi:hypothetical protein
MEKKSIINCDRCGNNFSFGTRFIKYRKKINLNSKFYCSEECRFVSSDVNVICDRCNQNFLKKKWEIKDGGKNFCSHKCSVTVSNSSRKLQKNRKKSFLCGSCGETTLLSVNAVSVCRNSSCKDYIPLWKEKRRLNPKRVEATCCKCESIFMARGAKYCPPCRAMRWKEIGNKSVLSQSRRSKNEIYFAELCEKHFGTIKKNHPQFNNWDADVIIDDLKIAVLWNGNWHYQTISKNVSLRQIQSRDKIKFKEIIKCGYTPYVIEDRGRHNPKFVEEQFSIFIKYVQTLQT